MKRIRLTFCCCLLVYSSFLKAQFSVATDASLLRNWNRHQRFLSIGQTVQTNFHLSKKESIYASIAYYTNGRFTNYMTARAKADSILPSTIPYTIHSNFRYRQLSLGWKHYFKGSYNEEDTWNLYGIAGFGLLFGKATNTFDKTIDTLAYEIQRPVAGAGNFKRLTFDAALGVESLIGTGFYLYSELRGWTASSHYPSPNLYQNSTNLPTALSINVGLRVLIE